MPPAAVVGAVATAAGAYSAGVMVFGLSVTASAIAIGVASFALSSLQSALAPKPKLPNLNGFQVKASNRTQQIRQPITARRLVYGECRVSGPLVFAASTQENKYVHLVIALASHEVEEIGEIWFDNTSIPPDYLDGSGNVTDGRYDGLVRIKKHLGYDGQNADSDLVSEVAEWTSSHKGRGIAYIYVRLKYDRDKFPTGIPNISAWVKGRKLFDTRDGTNRWSPNAALQARDYLADTKYGASASTIDGTAVTSAANECEEIVTVTNLDTSASAVDNSTEIITLEGTRLKYQLGDQVELTGTPPAGLSTGTDYYVIPYQRKGTPRIKLASSLDNAITGTAVDFSGTGTSFTVRKNGEPRYFGGGVVETDSPVGENLRDILSAMGGRAIYVGGNWTLLAAAYNSPSVTLDESHLRGPMRVSPKVSRRERFNTVKGVYVSPANDGQPSDYPVITNSTYKSADNGDELITDLDLPLTQRPHTAQRLAKIKLEQHRQEIVVEYPCSLHAMQLQPGDTVNITNDRMGWDEKVFEVMRWKLNVRDQNGAPEFYVDLLLQETASAVYDWNNGEETAVDPAPDTNLPDPFDVSAPVGLSVDSIRIETLGSDDLFQIVLSWEAHPNEFVVQGGQFQIQYKKTADSNWIPTGRRPEGDDTSADCFTGELGTNYDIRIRALNNLGIASSWSTLEGFTAGTAGGVESTEDWGDWSSGVGTTEDWDDWSGSPGTTEDWGGFTS